MVKIGIAGATGDVAKEVVDALVAKGKHEMLLFSRKDSAAHDETRPGVEWQQTDYRNVNALAASLKGVHTVLSFIDAMSDPENIGQRTLIDACVQAGVKRFAPSEWATAFIDDLPWYGPKIAVRQYLADLNKDHKVLEYSLFCPGIFTNYYTYPFPSAKHLNIFELNIDFHERRALLLEGGDDDRITLTTVQDLAQVVAQAIDHEGEWPLMGGINGCELSVGELLAVAKKIRGEFEVERLHADDLQQDPPVIKASWLPTVGHHSATKEMWQKFVPRLIAGILLANSRGSMKVPGNWNARLPSYRFTTVEKFLTEAWGHK